MKLSKNIHNVGFTIKQHSPTILVGAGVVGIVASAVLACRATLKVHDVFEETKQKRETINKVLEDKELVAANDYTEKDAKKDLTITYVQGGLKLIKLYAPSVILGALSISGIIASHHILSKRNVALASAYAIVDKGFKDYRKNVKDRFGERVDYELKHNIKAEKIKVESTDENGNAVTEEKEVDVKQSELDQYSDYARFFDECSPYWTDNAEYNLKFLKDCERFANEKLRLEGKLFLNEVYKMLGIPESKAGCIVGWVYPQGDIAEDKADGYVDFGIYDIYKRRAQEFVNGYEKSILLDFNVDGVIWEILK